MLLFMLPAGAPTADSEGMAEMSQFARDLAKRGKLRRGAPLVSDSEGVRVRVRDGEALVSDGPFAESKEVVGGFWIVDVANRAEAIAIARQCPHAREGTVEVHCVQRRYTFTDTEKGTPFLLAFCVAPGLTDPDGAKLREMIAFGEPLERAGTLFETAPLAKDPPPARVKASGGQITTTDGPFAESKEAVGGYSLVRVKNRGEAVELAKRYPHARWGTVEVREVMFFDRV
jgi:hypothetical protein